MATSVRDPELERVRRIARLLDDSFIDPILGFFLPGAGDLIGSGIGLYVIGLALRRRVAPIIIARMLLNLAVDAGIGAVPFAGDAFDVAWKANTRNLALLEQRTTGRGRASDWLAVIGAFALLAGVVGLAIWGVVALLRSVV